MSKTYKETVAILKELGVRVSKNTLIRYVRYGLLDGPISEKYCGRGIGRVQLYNDSIVYDAAATRLMLSENPHLTIKHLRLCRNIAKELVVDKNSVLKYRPVDRLLANGWLNIYETVEQWYKQIKSNPIKPI